MKHANQRLHTLTAELKQYHHLTGGVVGDGSGGGTTSSLKFNKHRSLASLKLKTQITAGEQHHQKQQ